MVSQDRESGKEPKRSPGWLRSIVLTALTAGAVGASLVAPPAAHADPAYCADVMLIGIRGSNQHDRFGPQVQIAVDQVRLAHRSEKRFRAEWIDYPAKIGNLGSEYDASRAKGYSAAFNKLSGWARECRQAKFAIIGFSQGAHIAGDLTQTIINESRPFNRSRVVDVALMGDPAFNGASPGVIRVGGGSGGGIKGRRAAWPSGFPVQSACINADPVCDGNGNVARAIEAMMGAGPHHEYAIRNWPNSRYSVAEQLGRNLAQLIGSGPRRY